MTPAGSSQPQRWLWGRIDTLLANVEWDRADLDQTSRDVYGQYRPFECLTRAEGIALLRDLMNLAAFKHWKRAKKEQTA